MEHLILRTRNNPLYCYLWKLGTEISAVSVLTMRELLLPCLALIVAATEFATAVTNLESRLLKTEQRLVELQHQVASLTSLLATRVTETQVSVSIC